MRILVLGASYGSLLGMKCIMAGHEVTLVCRQQTAKLINEQGTRVQIRLKGDDEHREFSSGDFTGRLDAVQPDEAEVAAYDLVVLAMQEPHYSHQSIWKLLSGVAEAKLPCISLMNIPPLPYLKRISGIDCHSARAVYSDARVWENFDPDLMTLCSPDPQAVRPPGALPNQLLVGLPTNFKAAEFGCPIANAKLIELSESIDEVRVDDRDVPVKLRIFASPFVPFAKWSMLLTGNYRCVTDSAPISIRDAVSSDHEAARSVYESVAGILLRLGAAQQDLVPFEKYASASLALTKPSSVARALASGATAVERTDRLVQIIGREIGVRHPEIDRTVARVNAALERNSAQAA
jgi:hypothetical protein